MIRVRLLSVDPMEVSIKNSTSEVDHEFEVDLPPMKMKVLDIPLAEASLQTEGEILQQNITVKEPMTLGEFLEWMFENKDAFTLLVQKAQEVLLRNPLIS